MSQNVIRKPESLSLKQNVITVTIILMLLWCWYWWK